MVLLLVLLAGLATDLASKYVAFNNVAERPVRVSREAVLEAQREGRPLGMLIPPHRPVTVVPHVLEFSLVLNPGAVFGIGAGRRWFFITFTMGALGLALWMFAAWTRPRDTSAHVAIGLLISGGLGNLYDRLRYACVRDFIHPLPGVKIPGTGRDLWPYVSNLADLWLLIGIGVLMWHLWRQGQGPEEAPAGDSGAR
jgi:signal peptidase II